MALGLQVGPLAEGGGGQGREGGGREGEGGGDGEGGEREGAVMTWLRLNQRPEIVMLKGEQGVWGAGNGRDDIVSGKGTRLRG
jgi:hypothetical protein